MVNKKCMHCKKRVCKDNTIKLLIVQFNNEYKYCDITVTTVNHHTSGPMIRILGDSRIHRIDQDRHTFVILVPIGTKITTKIVIEQFKKFANNMFFKGRYAELDKYYGERINSPFEYIPYNNDTNIDEFTDSMIDYYNAQRTLIKELNTPNSKRNH